MLTVSVLIPPYRFRFSFGKSFRLLLYLAVFFSIKLSFCPVATQIPLPALVITLLSRSKNCQIPLPPVFSNFYLVSKIAKSRFPPIACQKLQMPNLAKFIVPTLGRFCCVHLCLGILGIFFFLFVI